MFGGVSGHPADELLAREQRARRLLQWVAVAAAESTGVDEALRAVLDEVCRSTGWPLGHVLLRGADGAMTSAHLWHCEEPEIFGPFCRLSEETSFPPGVGLPGRVLASGRPHWIADVTRDANFPRRLRDGDLPVRGALGFPVLLRGDVLAVLEFFSSQPAEPDVPLLEAMAAIGTQLARVIERTTAEAALKASELRFRSVAETANDAIITADAAGRIVSWNRAAQAMFGHAEAEVIGRPLTVIIPERLREKHTAGMERVRAGGERHVIGRTVELEGLRRDGSEFPIELSLAEWGYGGERFFTGILRDVSERRESLARLRAAAETLARSERQAVEASRAKSTFLAHMSHELRTPLNAILGFVQIMDRDRTLGPEQRDNLAVILRSGEHLLGLIDDVLSISAIEAGEAALRPVDFSLRPLLRALREMFSPRAAGRGIALSFDVDPALPSRVRGDQGKLRQVLTNLLGNAAKFTEKGGITLRVRWRDGRAAFEVEDSGPGIAPEDLERVFQPFGQASRASAHEGTGLGLAISSDFVRLMGGELRVTSQVGRGSCFSFQAALEEIPDEGEPAAEPRRVVALAPGQPEQRLLVVDNAADSRRLLARLLGSVGFVIEEAADGEDAVARWARFRPRLVWMDMRMPVLDGYEATRRIRAAEAAAPAGSRTVIVALTASAFDHDRAGILAAGCDDVVAKPFAEAVIFETLRRSLDVAFQYEERPPERDVPEPARWASQLAAVPHELVAQLQQALGTGDDLLAQEAVDRIAAHDRSLGRELRVLVKGFRFDELLGILERTT
jgi:two-component system, sensor histidine kinase and response regulator